MAQYEWKRRPSGAPKAAVAGRYIQGLNRRHKGVSAEVLVAESRAADSPLHGCFEWNNRKAAGEYRKEQARLILRSLVIVVQESDDAKPIKVNAFVSFDDQPEYVTIQSVIADEDLDRKYKIALLAELNSTKRKCAQYEEFTEACEAIGNIRVR